MASLSVAIAFGVRLLLVLLFLPFSALDKILNFKGAVGQARQAVHATAPATALILLGLCVEIGMSLRRLNRTKSSIAAGTRSA